MAIFALLTSAVAGVFLGGVVDQGGIGILLGVSGIVLLAIGPRYQPDRSVLILIGLAVLGLVPAFLPDQWFFLPAWKEALASDPVIEIPSTVTMQPMQSAFWCCIFVGILGCFLFIYASPLTSGMTCWIAVVAVASCGVYAVLAITDRQTAWTYPFSTGATFGFFPNRNHTSSLLSFGAVVSLGILFHDLLRGRYLRGVITAASLVACLVGLLLFTESRAGIVLVPLGVLIWLTGMGRRLLGHRALVTVSIFLVVALYIFFSESNLARDRILAAFSSAQTEGAVATESRIPIFFDTIHLVGQHVLTGVGLGGFAAAFPFYSDHSLGETGVFHPDSSWLMFASEAGVIPVIALAACGVLVVWRVWRVRSDDFWSVRWGLACGGLVMAFHGVFDVPLHRTSLAWFALVPFAVGVAMMPRSAPRPRLIFQLLLRFVGLVVLVLGTMMIRAQWFGGASLPPFQWADHEHLLQQASERRDFEDGEKIALQAMKEFPLQGDAYYWHAAFLLRFEGTDLDAARSMAARSLIAPEWPWVSVEHARLWSSIDPGRAAASWGDAVRRALRIDLVAKDDSLRVTSSVLAQAIAEGGNSPEVTSALTEGMIRHPRLMGEYLKAADDENAARVAASIPDPVAFLVGLPSRLQEPVGSRLLAMNGGEALARAIADREAGLAADQPSLWRVLAAHYARAGDFQRAVETVAAGGGWDLAGSEPTASSLYKTLEGLRAERNSVTLRRIIRETTSSPNASADDLYIILRAHVADGNWKEAWEIASRIKEKDVSVAKDLQ